MTSYLSENEAENLQNGNVLLAKNPDFEIEYLEKYWHIEVGDGSFACIFHALSFGRNIFSTGISLYLQQYIQTCLDETSHHIFQEIILELLINENVKRLQNLSTPTRNY